MKHSIRLKITCLLTALIIFTIFLCWLLNRTFLVDYYLYSKKETLGNTYEQIQKIYQDGEKEGVLSEDAINELESIDLNHDVKIYVVTNTNHLKESYPALEDYSEKESMQIFTILKEYIFSGSNSEVVKKVLDKTDSYYIYSLLDDRTDTRYIDLVGYLNENYIVFLRSNYQSMQESVVIANKFLTYIGILATIIGTIAMLFISRKFTKPILKLADIAKRMSDLDFNVKYEVKTQDEVGELGNSINALSEKLQGTISELKSANNELLTDIQKKIEVDEMRKEFLSNVSHELKTPISLIQGYAEGLKENINEDVESRDFYCEVIMDEANKMNKMVKKLLTLNQIEFGNNQINIDRFDIVALIRAVINSTEILMKQKEVIVHFEENESIYVWADEYMIEEVVTNYISNALNHVSGAKIIEIKLIQHDEVVRVAVFNTGDTIPEKELEKIWGKFYKVDKARTREYGGNGIGLSIVKAIMNSLNHEFGVINREIGVEFWFEVDTKI